MQNTVVTCFPFVLEVPRLEAEICGGMTSKDALKKYKAYDAKIQDRV